MHILVLGGTRFMGRHLVNALLEKGHRVTLATRGLTEDDFGSRVFRIKLERTSAHSLQAALCGLRFDAVCDSLAYCSNDVRALMEAVSPSRYVMISSASVYNNLAPDTGEETFNPLETPLVWCGRTDFPYNIIKQQAECALFQQYGGSNPAAVRFPYVIGPDDYTQRLFFYVSHVAAGLPMHIDNLESRLAFVQSEEAGRFLAFLAENGFTGSINGCNPQTVSLKEVLDYTAAKTGKAPVLSQSGDPGPYNGCPSYSLNTGRAASLGFSFSPLSNWIFALLDAYIEKAGQLSR